MSSGLWKPKNQHERDWLRGVKDALALVAEFDKYVAHDYRLSDCILMKLNISNRVRKNVRVRHTNRHTNRHT